MNNSQAISPNGASLPQTGNMNVRRGISRYQNKLASDNRFHI